MNEVSECHQAMRDQRETKLKCNKTERDTDWVWTQAEEAAHYAELARGNMKKVTMN
mgnify:CR=1 FL=1